MQLSKATRSSLENSGAPSPKSWKRPALSMPHLHWLPNSCAIAPGTRRKHKHRSETWNLVSGTAHLLTSNRTIPEDPKRQDLSPPNPVDIPANVWHKGVNNSDEPAHIVEVWKGPSEMLREDDIERHD